MLRKVKAKILSSVMIICGLVFYFPMVSHANVWGGAEYNGVSSRGAEANITFNSTPTVYTGGFGGAWVMLGSADLGLGQIGWAYRSSVNSGKPYLFYASRGLNIPYQEYSLGTISTGTTNKYTVCLNGTNVIDGYINGVFRKSATIDFNCTRSIFEGERSDNSAQFPGKTSSHEKFSNVKWYKPNVGWQTLTSPGITWWSHPNAYNVGLNNANFDAQNFFEIWDMGF